ncbi:HNH endonuclease [Pseudaeromonas phage vB_PpeM_ KLEP7]|nr:HNH endonuclease [Pseudaeromonas phage vB_PpeM_ KLEP7]
MTQYLKEEFKTLVDEEGLVERYKISNYGRVLDTQTNNFISQVLTGGNPYFYVNYNTPIKRKLRRVHNLMARAFLSDSYYEGASVDHIDINPYNNSLDNLRWATRKQQARNLKTNRYLINNGNKQLIREYIEDNKLTEKDYQWLWKRAIRADYNPENILQEFKNKHNRQPKTDNSSKVNHPQKRKKWLISLGVNLELIEDFPKNRDLTFEEATRLLGITQ